MQQLEVVRNVEEFVFWCGNDDELYNAKHELVEQFNKFHIAIRAKGFFDMNRQFLATVSTRALNSELSLFFNYSTSRAFSTFQFLSAGCTYVIIILQFDLALNHPIQI